VYQNRRNSFGLKQGVNSASNTNWVRVENTSSIEPRSGKISFRKFLVWAAVFIFSAFAIEALFSDTSIITPINSDFLFAMRVVGATAGFGIAIAMIVFPQSDAEAVVSFGWGKKILSLIFLPLMIAFVFDCAAWRIANAREFAFTRQPFVTVTYPVEYVSQKSRRAYFVGRDHVEIDPFDTRHMTDIPIPDWQYQKYWLIKDPICVTVMSRKSPSGAVQIKTDGSANLSEPEPAQIGICPAGITSRTFQANEEYRNKRPR
jgi:hypothetical protein